MSIEVKRPEAAPKKIHNKDEFELCYIRHKYIRKTDSNPTDMEMRPYYKISHNMGRNTHFTYKSLFLAMGFEADDVISICRIHLVSFLGLFSMERMPEKYAKFEAIFQTNNLVNPEQEDILNKNKANFTLFLKQRMEDLVRICRQKAANVKGVPTIEYIVYVGPNRPPADKRILAEGYESLGFRKLDYQAFKGLRRRHNLGQDLQFRVDDLFYVCVPQEQRTLDLTDLVNADMDPYDNIHNMDPERLISMLENETILNRKIESFQNSGNSAKISKIRKFLKKNASNPKFADEVKTAERMLCKLIEG